MTLPIVLRKIARREFDTARDWYEARRVGLGDQFVAEVDLTLKHIAENPEIFAVLHRSIRAALVGRFPYAIYFRVRSGEIRVLGIIHTARNPAVWQKR